MKEVLKRESKKVKTVKSPYGMVSTASSVATEAGSSILQKGGNAVDAAVAAAFCLGVTEPQASGLGGQSMALLRHVSDNDISLVVYDGSSRAPFGINPNRLPAKPVKDGIRATTVPSTPATLGYLHETYGKLSFKEVLNPAICAASDGFKLSELQHKLINREKERLVDPVVRSVLFKNGKPLNAGDTVYQPKLSETLAYMAEEGWRDFYLGRISDLFIEDMMKRNGLISRADLSQIPYPIQRDVLWGEYRGQALATFPPPGAGRALVQILNTLENFEPEELDPANQLYEVLLAMAFRAALIKRERFPIDADLYPQLTDKWMVDKQSALSIATRIKKLLKYLAEEPYPLPPTSGETTHLSVADADGNVVGITQSIELVFGSKTMAEGLGFFYNNYMGAFDYKDMMHPNYLVPGGRPASSVAPTLLFRKNGTPLMMLGSPGSERIATTLAQVITRVVDLGQGLAEAIEAPRLHAGTKGTVAIEKRDYNAPVLETLTRSGFKVKPRGAYSFYLGCVQAVELPQKTGEPFTGVADPRRDGSACGPEYLQASELKKASEPDIFGARKYQEQKEEPI